MTPQSTMGSQEGASESATSLLEHFRDGSRSPVEVAQACLAVIEDTEPRLHAFASLDPETAMTQAKASEERWSSGHPRGLLDGVPVGVKDVFLAAGTPTLRGFPRAPVEAAWDIDAPVVAALRRHGAVIVGKTTTPQFGWKPVTDGPGVPTTRNPWNPEYTSGGSSGGSATALGSGMVPLALGTDGGGSIRLPASFCGIVGLKPTYARIPLWPPSPFGLLSHAGPMARTVTDTALLLDVLAEPDPREWAALPPPNDRYRDHAGARGDLAGLRVAFSADLGYVDVAPEISEAVGKAARALSELGADVESVDPGFDSPGACFDVFWSAGAVAAVRTLPEELSDTLETGLRDRARRGSELSMSDVADAEATRARLGALMGDLHKKWDVLVTPTMPILAFEADRDMPPGANDQDWSSWTPFTYPFNITQQPAISIPCGFTTSGLPIGLQIVGPRHSEALLIRVAAAYEATFPQPTLRASPGSTS